MLQRLVWILAAFALAHGLPASALGLGSIEVQSHLNEPFSAVISLYSLSEDDASSLQVQLAPAAEFQKANINRSDYLPSLRFTVNGGRVKVSSDQPVREPFLNLLVEAKAGSSRVLRSYTILFDPPSIAAPAPAAAPAAAPAPAKTPAASSEFYETAAEAGKAEPAAPAAKPAPVPVAVPPPGPTPAPTTAPVAAAAAPAAAAPAPAQPKSTLAAATSYGPVKAGQTFWTVATLMRPSNAVTMDQTLLALYQANPSAFVGGFNGLLVGSTLKVPSEEQMRSVSADEARRKVLELRKTSTAQNPTVAPVPEKAPALTAAPAAAKSAAVATQAPTPKPAPAPVAAPAPAVVAAAPAPSKPAAAVEPAPVAIPAPAPAPAPARVEAPRPEPIAAQPAPAASTESPRSSSLDQQAAPPPPADANDPSMATEPVDGAGTDFASPVHLFPRNPLEPYLPALIAGVLVFAAVLVWMIIRRRRQAETFRRDTIEDYMRPSSPREASAFDPLPIVPTRTAATPQFSNLSPGPRSAPSLDATPAQEPKPSVAPEPGIRPKRSEPLTAAPVIPSVVVPVAAKEPEPEPVPAPVKPDPAQTVLPGLDLSEPALAAPSLHSQDPLQQADFHLSYGLYDEAVRGLMAALMRNPGRQDLALKLAETYFAAGRSADFESLADGLKDRVSEDEWQLLTEMGRQLCPDSKLFAPPPPPPPPPPPVVAAPPPPPPATAPEPKPEPEREPEPVPEPPAIVEAPVATEIRPSPRSSELRFDVRPDLRAEPRTEIRPEKRPDPRSDRLLDLLTEPGESRAKPQAEIRPQPRFDAPPEPRPDARSEPRTEPRREPSLLGSGVPAPAAATPPETRSEAPRREPRFESQEPKAPSRTESRKEPRMEPRIEPGLGAPPPVPPVQVPPEPVETPPEMPAEPVIEVHQRPAPEPFKLSPSASGRREPLFPPMQSASAMGDEEAAVKLDLARAYIDMGDIKAARALLQEVAQQGSFAQQGDARTLLMGLPG